VSKQTTAPVLKSLHFNGHCAHIPIRGSQQNKVSVWLPFVRVGLSRCYRGANWQK